MKAENYICKLEGHIWTWYSRSYTNCEDICNRCGKKRPSEFCHEHAYVHKEEKTTA